jgi:hypothetical protein
MESASTRVTLRAVGILKAVAAVARKTTGRSTTQASGTIVKAAVEAAPSAARPPKRTRTRKPSRSRPNQSRRSIFSTSTTRDRRRPRLCQNRASPPPLRLA